MRKDKVFTMRMSRHLHDLLKRAAARERRSAASLLENLIHAHLAAVGLTSETPENQERRSAPRRRVLLPALAHIGQGEERRSLPCVVVDLSCSGVGLVQPRRLERGLASNGGMPHFELTFNLPREGREVRISCAAEHLRETENEIQVGASFTEEAPEISSCIAT